MGEATLSGKAYAYDGDSIFFGRKVEVRLTGIDAPELAQTCHDGVGALWPCGKAAREALRRMIQGRTLHCTIEGKDKYRRLLGVC